MDRSIGRSLATVFVVAILSCVASNLAAQEPELVWGPPPPSLPSTARMALLKGDPKRAGLFVVRFRLPDGFTVPPHFHPVDEHVRVISGEYGHGFGDVVDTTKIRWLHPGDRVVLPARSHHYTRARGATETEVSGMGPFVVTYVKR